MIRSIFKKIPLLIGIASLTGCVGPLGKDGYVRDRSGDYTLEEKTQPIKLPEDLKNAKPMSSALVIPKTNNNNETLPSEFVVPRPAQLTIAKSAPPPTTASALPVNTPQNQINIRGNAVLTQDGNGSPLITIRGATFDNCWQAVGDALNAAQITIVDRNSAAGIYLISLNSTPEDNPLHVQLTQLTHSVQLSVEKSATTAADPEVSQQVLESIKAYL